MTETETRACPYCFTSVPADAATCPKCRQELRRTEYVCPTCSEVVPHDARVCPHCGQVYDVSDEDVTPPAPEPEYAGWGRRGVAWLLDQLLLGTVLLIVVSATGDPDFLTDPNSDASGWVLLLYVIPLAYFTVMIGWRGQTLGKMALGIAVLRGEDAGRVSYARALGRAGSVYLLSVFIVPILVSYLWPLWDRRNQALHDKMANTIVVRR